MIIYVINKTNMGYVGQFYSIAEATSYCLGAGISSNVIYMEEIPAMKYISRVTYVDGVCIYNDKTYWETTAWTDKVLDNFESHTVTDWMNLSVDKARFKEELYSNSTRINQIDGIAGEINYNITVGNEFVALFREECVRTDFKNTSPLAIGIKLESVISLVQTGSFREAKSVLKSLATDEFLTTERIAKYIAMMESADAIDYATSEEYYYEA